MLGARIPSVGVACGVSVWPLVSSRCMQGLLSIFNMQWLCTGRVVFVEVVAVVAVVALVGVARVASQSLRFPCLHLWTGRVVSCVGGSVMA